MLEGVPPAPNTPNICAASKCDAGSQATSHACMHRAAARQPVAVAATQSEWHSRCFSLNALWHDRMPAIARGTTAMLRAHYTSCWPFLYGRHPTSTRCVADVASTICSSPRAAAVHTQTACHACARLVALRWPTRGRCHTWHCLACTPPDWQPVSDDFPAYR